MRAATAPWPGVERLQRLEALLVVALALVLYGMSARDPWESSGLDGSS